MPESEKVSPHARVLRIMAVLGLFLVGCALLVWVSFWLAPTPPARVILIGAGYEENLALPHNVPGRVALNRFADLARSSGSWSFLFPGAGKLSLAHEPVEYRTGTDWARGLQDAEESTVILYFALHGGADPQGPYLLPQNTSGNPRERLRVEAILDRLAELPSDTHKLLILDATGMDADWRLGMLNNDFVRGLVDLDEKIASIPNLVVLSSSDIDQRSWSAPAWRTSIFAHHLLGGLQGTADRDKNGRLDGWELYRYIRREVEDWVRINRQAYQSPLLLPTTEGEKRARRMSLTFRFRSSPPEADVPSPSWTRVQTLWQEHQRASEQKPAPVVYAPYRWQEYEAVLLRHEQLVRAGDQEYAPRLHTRARQLRREMEAERYYNLTSLTGAFPMPATAGYVDFEADPLTLSIGQLWNASATDLPKVYEQLQKNNAGSDLTQQKLLRLKLYDLVYRRALSNPARDLARAATLTPSLDDSREPGRPAESHYLVMLHRDLPADPLTLSRTLILRQALQLRLQAEQTALSAHQGSYSYSGQLYPWIQTRVEQADQTRQQGQDLLFSSDFDDWQKADKLFSEAQKQYSAAEKDTRQLRQALSIRDRTLAVLPAYSHWLARSLRGEGERLMTNVEDLWKRTHELGRRTVPVRPLLSNSSAVPPDLGALASDIERGVKQVETQFLDRARELAGRRLTASWYETEAVLGVPTIEPNLRLRLLRLQQRRARASLTSMDSMSSEGEVPVEDVTKVAKKVARQQGRMALAVLGEKWFDSYQATQDSGSESFDAVRHRLDLFSVEEKWWKSLERAGEEIGKRWQQMPSIIEQLTQSARKQQKPEAMWTTLADADRLLRRVGAGASAPGGGRLQVPFRKAMLQSLLLWQAERTLKGRWYTENPRSSRPYYLSAGRQLVLDARRHDPFGRKSPSAVTRLETRLGLPDSLRLIPTPTRHLTAGESLRVQCTVESGASSTSGYPVVWATSSKGTLRLGSAQAGNRSPRVVPQSKPSEPLTVEVTSPQLDLAEANPPARPQSSEADVLWHGLYRGQQLTAQTPIILHPLAEAIRTAHPPPRTAAVAIRATRDVLRQYGASRGALTVVLDCSGSMGPPTGQPMNANTRFRQVTGVLRQVLGELPRGTVVSIWVFGEAIGARRTVSDPERTIRRLQDPITFTGRSSQIDTIMNRVEALTPWNESPITEAILQARRDLRDATGPKTMLVLTDGMDNRWSSDRRDNPRKQSIPDALQAAFKGSDIMLNVIGFQISEKEEKAARKQFGVVKDLDPPGMYVNISDAKTLLTQLRLAISRQLRYRLVRVDDEGKATGEGTGSARTASTVGASNRWQRFGASDIPGTFQLQLSQGSVGSRRSPRQRIALSGGDLMLLNLFSSGTNLSLERSLFSEEPAYRLRPFREKRGWRISLLQNQRIAQALQMLLAMEKSPDPRTTTIQQRRPRSVWIELLTPEGSSQPFSLRWSKQPGYPAPTWTLDVSDWPRSANTGTALRPRVHVYFSPTRLVPAAVELKRDEELRALGNLAREIRVGGEVIRLESVQVEEHWVQTTPAVVQGKPTSIKKKWCLAVRLSHPLPRPFYARPEGLTELAGEEHRFYQKAGKYVGLFWFSQATTEDQVRNLVETTLGNVQLISVDQFRTNARRLGYLAEFDDLSLPAPNQVRPQPQ